MGSPWEVAFCPLGGKRDALGEIAKQLTDRQLQQIRGQFERLERYGTDLGHTYFRRVRSSRLLREFRLTAERLEVRFLYYLDGRRFLMLKGFRHTSDDDVDRHVPTAERRLRDWTGIS